MDDERRERRAIRNQSGVGMSLLWIEGFEGLGSTDSAHPAPTGVLTRKYGTVNWPDYMWLLAGRFGGHCIDFSGVWAELYTPDLTTNATMVVGLAYYFTAAHTAKIVALHDGSTLGMNLKLAENGELAVYRGTTFLNQTQGLGLHSGTWYYIEFKVLCNSSTGTFEVRVGGVNKLSATGVNTKAGSHDYHTKVGLFGPGSGACWFDDWYVLDGAGSANNDFLGNRKVVALFPNSDVGGYQDFTCSSGSDHYALVDDNPVNDDTDYVESSTSGHKDLWDYPSLSGTGSTISGLQVNSMVKESDANPFTFNTLIKSGTTEDAGTGEAIGSTSYKVLRRISETDPNTSSAWTTSGVNAAQFGIKVA